VSYKLLMSWVHHSVTEHESREGAGPQSEG
jgi:hypothetical protein